MGLGVNVCSKLKALRVKGEAKASLNRAISFRHYTRSGGDLPMVRLKLEYQSNPVIAGSLRNIFRYSLVRLLSGVEH